MTLARLLPIALLFAFTPACATTQTTSAAWDEEPAPALRYGQVTWVREYVEHVDGDPAAGAVAGAIIGGLLAGDHGPGTLVGVLGGAGIGAAVSQGHSESRYYDITVRFEDGGEQIFRFRDSPPFRPGENVVLTPQGGLARS